MTADRPPTLLWLRRDLRLDDHPGWRAALADGGPVVPVFILDSVLEQSLGAAARWRLGRSLASLGAELARRGSRLVLRRGPAGAVLPRLVAETGACRVVWSRLYDPESVTRDSAIKEGLAAQGIGAASVNAFLLFEPWTVATGSGGPYRVFTPFWTALRGREVAAPLAQPRDLAPPDAWPASDRLDDWRLGAAVRCGAACLARHARVGEAAARERLAGFVADRLGGYAGDRDRLDLDGGSGLSENLAHGEVSPRRVWHAVRAAMANRPGVGQGGEAFLRQLGWREFAWHLLYHTPQLATGNWRAEWDRFPWRDDNADAERWRRGLTGEPVVDAAMRQLWVTGTMHNRARMLVASYLTKHLATHWRVGAEWFRDCLTDWDPAANALGWQWCAGSGPDAAPFFRIFNPATQAGRFDPEGRYRARFLASGGPAPHADAAAFYAAAPAAWRLDPQAPAPAPLVDLAEGRRRALALYEGFRAGS